MLEENQIRVTIDGRDVSVPAGTTVLSAARQAGVDIPVLCYLDGHPPFTSCFVCAVRVEGRAGFVPACAAPVTEGMAVRSDAEDVRAARRTGLELLLSDHVGECEAPCVMACPAGLDIPRMLAQTGRGDGAGAMDTVMERIPFSGSLGRICPRYCERVCRRDGLDAALSVCALKRFAWERGREVGWSPVPVAESGKRVAVVGGGPAGLSAAWFIRRMGHACTVFEAESELGGWFRYGVPEFQVPSAVVREEVSLIRATGIAVEFGWRLRTGEQLGELREQFDAVVLALGAQRTGKCESVDGLNVPSALEFLRRVSRGERPEATGTAAVLGWGNEALAAARCLVRLGAGDVRVFTGPKPAKSAAFESNVREAQEEGVVVVEGAVAESVEPSEDHGWVLGVRQGESRDEVRCRTLLNAQVRIPDSALIDALGLPVKGGRASAGRATWETGVPGVFAIGEMVTGASSGVRAVAAGRQVAFSVAQFLRGEAVLGEPKAYNHRLGQLSEEELVVQRGGAEPASRQASKVLDPQERGASFREVTPSLPAELARAEAGRCLQCSCLRRDDCALRDTATEYGARQASYAGARRELKRTTASSGIVYESGKCILCGRCLAIAERSGETPGLSFVERGFRTRVAVPFEGDLGEALRPDTLRACCEACPTGALATETGAA